MTVLLSIGICANKSGKIPHPPLLSPPLIPPNGGEEDKWHRAVPVFILDMN